MSLAEQEPTAPQKFLSRRNLLKGGVGLFGLVAAGGVGIIANEAISEPLCLPPEIPPPVAAGAQEFQRLEQTAVKSIKEGNLPHAQTLAQTESLPNAFMGHVEKKAADELYKTCVKKQGSKIVDGVIVFVGGLVGAIPCFVKLVEEEGVRKASKKE